MRLLLVFNPRAAGGKSRPLLDPIVERFKQFGVESEVLLTHHPGSAIGGVATHSLQDIDAVIAVGGDGTLFDVLNGLYLRKPENRRVLGIIPVGTGNAFCRDIGLEPGNWKKAVDVIIQGHRQPIDVGQVTTVRDRFWFLNIMGMGFAAGAGRAALAFKRFGPAAYTLGTLWQTLKLGSYPLRMEIDGQLIEQDNVFVEISNTRFTGTSFLMAPQALPDDGWFDITLLSSISRLRLLRLFPGIYSGRHVNYEEVSCIRGQVIRLLEPEGYELQADGEFRGETPAEIRVLPRDLEVFSSAQISS